MEFSVFTLFTTLLLGALYLLISVPLAPYVLSRYSIQMVVGFAILFIFRLLFPVEFFFTTELQSTRIMPIIQKTLEYKLFDILAIKWIILIVYIAGLLITIYKRHLNTAIRSKRHLKKILGAVSTPLAKETMNQLLKDKGWRFRHQLYQGNQITSVPMMYGFNCAHIYLPDYDFDSKDLYNILAHECTHFVLRDNLWKLLTNIVFTLYYFLPVKQLKKTLENLFEHRCDEYVLRGKSQNERRKYINSIEYILDQNRSQGTLTKEQTQILEARKKRILTPPRQTWLRKGVFFAFMISIFFLSFAFVIQPRVEPKGFEQGQEDAGQFQINEQDGYAIMNDDGTVSVYYEDMILDMKLDSYYEEFTSFPLRDEKPESEDVTK